jgi:hypothetical protein
MLDMRMNRIAIITTPLLAGLAALGLTACGDNGNGSTTGTTSSTTVPASPTTTGTAAVVDPGDGGSYEPRIDSANFVAVIDNPYYPLPVGARWRYEGTSDGERQTTEITVTDQKKTVMGIDATVVRDVVKREDGELIEDTMDWFAQDRDGNVWYLGESVKDYEDGKVVSTAGSWEAGVDGALPGIVMPAEPNVGDAYRQEYYAGEAEDMMKITATDGQVTVRAGSFTGVVVTIDWTPLEPEVIEEKSYAKGVGRVLEEKTRGGSGRSELVEYALGT